MENWSWEITAWAVSTAIASLGAAMGLWQARQSYNQRKLEYRWRQAEMGKKLVDEMFEDEDAYNAALIMDKILKEVTLPSGERVPVSMPDVVSTLKSPDSSGMEMQLYIHRCFDSFFYHLDRFEHFIQINLVRREDVSVPARYYATILSKYDETFKAYLNYIGYIRALQFLEHLWDDSFNPSVSEKR